eukprot:TRINITY_DN33_c0_g1_i6.p1 TRINITY_DN33_c0_g1~~TRINITY_DN33_c0_g1_i6.p1  ORF type:complete len:281 (-),score=97.81 TRINITY_DN33_c0_g1_i6:85-927(-)
MKDANNEVSGGECDDGLEGCDCDTGVLVPETNPLLSDALLIEVLPDICFCSDTYTTDDFDIDTIADPTLTTGTTTVTHGTGSCVCKDGIHLLRMIYYPEDLGNSPVNIEISRDSLFTNDIICTFDNVQAGTEVECDIQNVDPTLTKWNKFDATTYVRLTSIATGDICEGQWQTTCSTDIVGWAAATCTDIIITGWSDNGNDGECDDGLYSCTCKDCSIYSTTNGPTSVCASTDGCFYNEVTTTCDPLSTALWQGSNAPTRTNAFAVALSITMAAMVVAFN